jgi:sugar phosphate isomerase/epimerase
MSNEHSISRRKFLGAAAGAAGAAALGSWAPRAFGGPGGGVGERLVPPGKLAVQHFSIRDAITRRSIASSTAAGLAPTMGYLGGPNFPDDPTDLGPLVPLPGGFIEVFEYLGSVGYRGFEFFQYTQNAVELGRQPTIAEIRSYLDNAGLASVGTHTGGLGAMVNPTTRQAQIDIAHTLGHSMIGTAGDPVTGGGAALLANWEVAANNYNLVGAALAQEGLRYYLHPEQNNFNFFNDPAHPELSRVHRLDWFVANTDPSLAWLEPDILHSYAGRARFPDPVDGSLWGAPLDFWKANSKRILAWHVKDGSRLVPPPARGVNPFTQVIQRTPTFQDAILSGEGSIGQGYPVDPDPAVVGYKKIFDEVGEKGSRYYIVETDSGLGQAADPGRSLRHAKYSLQNMLGLRGGVKAHGKSTVADEADYESNAVETAG